MALEDEKSAAGPVVKQPSARRGPLRRAMEASGRDLIFTVGVVLAGLLSMVALALSILEL
ncbi:hypothetical protein JQ633_31690 [Bradyrhizobium tropiciagri]|uniref:hypothetical protein n=1 Tax=Bradyrhizobium tropiciagri TaxID=312253 RepID=UPI001BAD0BB3|nr:hypothetical protein [Bradyrhizobium tropiciagri]MBR0874958.1 hypothetical protein [Bradyrhizobium tropiciagri]